MFWSNRVTVSNLFIEGEKITFLAYLSHKRQPSICLAVLAWLSFYGFWLISDNPLGRSVAALLTILIVTFALWPKSSSHLRTPNRKVNFGLLSHTLLTDV